MKILIVAENISSKYGGESILPLHYFRYLKRRGHRVWLITHARGRDDLLGDLSPAQFSDVCFVSNTKLSKLLYWIGRRLPHRLNVMTVETLMYLISEIRIKKLVREIVLEKGIEVVHRPYPVSPKRPSLLYSVGAPIVMGPMNGGMEFPPGFKHMESSFEKYFVKWIRYCSEFANWVIPGKKKAEALIVANQRTLNALPRYSSSNIYMLPENGVDMSLWKSASVNPNKEHLFVFMGRMVDWKNIEVLIKAMDIVVKKIQVRLILLGNGPIRDDLEFMVNDLGLASHVQFLGFLHQEECRVWVNESVALLLPSLYECGGAVVLEAMAMGKPVIATDWGGPRDYLTEKTGILVKSISMEQMIGDFAAAMIKLVESPELCESLGKQAQKRIESEFDWEKKINAIEKIYKQVLESYHSD